VKKIATCGSKSTKKAAHFRENAEKKEICKGREALGPYGQKLRAAARAPKKGSVRGGKLDFRDRLEKKAIGGKRGRDEKKILCSPVRRKRKKRTLPSKTTDQGKKIHDAEGDGS